MSQAAICVEGLSKRYRIGQRERYLALRDVLTRSATAPFRWLAGRRVASNGDSPAHIWALKDVSFQVGEGDVTGIIGRNGSGKSTLLKILARITEPTRGTAEVYGQVGSLLEVGTGFHPELTGRENVYLSGAILSMKKREIDRKFDEIVSFAELEKFIDTTVKYYSTGMQMRLAFAVAAHLEPKILLVDEVLAVGDAGFQRKCLGKMGDVASGGRTVLFVSHQMNQIRRLCQRVILLDGGRVRQFGVAEQVLAAYEELMASLAQAPAEEKAGLEDLCVLGWDVIEPRGTHSNAIASGLGPVSLKMRVKTSKAIRHGHMAALISDQNGLLVSGWAFDNLELRAGMHEVHLEFPVLPLRPGAYEIMVNLQDDSSRGQIWNLIPPLIMEGTPVTHFMDEWAGVLNIPCSLECRQID